MRRELKELHGDLVVCNVTEHGLKQPEAIQLSEKEFAPIVPTLQALREQIERTQEINDRDKFEFSR